MHMRRAGIFILLLFLCCSIAYGAEPSVGAQGAALVDGNTGRLLWGKNEEEPLAMASTTKIMTAMIILENAKLDDVVTVSKNAANQPEVHMDLKTGEQWRVGDLLSVMMLRSYNDTAVALAEHVSGSVEAFCELMTKKAAEIGAADTVFGSPNGLDSQIPFAKHHSTAKDMALIAAYALKNEEFCRIIALSGVTIYEVTGKRQCNVTNADRFLQEYQGAMGVKTGYTNKAGHCFVGAAEQNGVRLVSAVLGSGWGNTGKEKKWTDTKAIMNYGFATFFPYVAAQQGQSCGNVSILHSKVGSVEGILQEGYEGLFSKEEQDAIKLYVSLPESIEAPIQAGQKLGNAQLKLKNEVLAEIPILADCSAPAYTLRDWYLYLSQNWITWF
ncbi:D-alanyl-D-alanine carboxypeptidase DacB precursor [Anaerotignum neopropionicum]|uniref:serine-type D-Ala-D-Ala carboxypeptidase n=1 Tax=Anaerotignum neopropionicum TaxID=36847 RepID=A0A136WDM2_9FIRM|nr:D-alanyl-D-alanine carboxypeptidase family protein [Anaerotignum neopropionicum]KXL52561.1 D-alanyl-D-alanine carboxypeptidase DacB precursor [Anaerotignum neopropionicum]